MSIISEIKKEHKKVSQEIENGQRKLRALESMMQEYNLRLYPSPSVLQELIIGCLKQNNGGVGYESIYECLISHGVEISRPRLSQALTSYNFIKFNGITKRWEFVEENKLAA